jgi:CheY-like chemotaxis protein
MTPIEKLEDFFANVLHKIQSEEESREAIIHANMEKICLSINETFKQTHVHALSILRLLRHEDSTREYTLEEQIKILESSRIEFILELLSCSREILKLHRSMAVDTKIYEISRASSTVGPAVEKTWESYLPKARCLIVDDEPVNIRILSNLLKKNGICDHDSINHCLNAEETFTFLETNSKNIDIIFLDNHLGITSLRGDEIIKELIKLYPHITFVFATSDSSYRESYITLGFDGYLDKPFSGKKLVDTLSSIFSSQMVSTSEKFKKWTQSLKK